MSVWVGVRVIYNVCIHMSCLWLEIILAVSRQQGQEVVYFQIKIFVLLRAFNWEHSTKIVYTSWCIQGGITHCHHLEVAPILPLKISETVNWLMNQDGTVCCKWDIVVSAPTSYCV